jgi:hypothetical protein
MIVAWLAWGAWAAEPGGTFPAGEIRTVWVRTAGGPVRIDALPEATEVTAQVNRDNWGDGCRAEVTAEGGTLRVLVEKPTGKIGFSCTSEVVVTAPASMALDVVAPAGDLFIGGFQGGGSLEVGLGDIRLAGTSGPLSVRGSVGDLVGSYLGPDLRVHWDSGQVRLTGLVGTVGAEVGAGKLELDWDKAPEGHFDLAVSAGSMNLAFPAAAPIDLDLDVKVGRLRNELDAALDAPTHVHARVGAGSIKVTGR